MTAPPMPGRSRAGSVIAEAPTALAGDAGVGNQVPRGRSYRGKRMLDLVVVSLIIVPAALLCAIAALAHLLAHGRPVLFRQQRVGRDNHPFVVLKLRTMHDAPCDSTRPGDADQARVTAVGRVLRRTSLDELPQLVNVLRGEMSLVGPRPTLPYQVHRYTGRQRLRLLAAPGLTGLAQVHGRQCLSWPERIEWDLRYVRRQSFWLDLAILFLTVWTVLARGGATVGHDNDPIAGRPERMLSGV
ncbi:sugar transferase [Streptomyces sp. ME18-1-4]|uniref:sugar transferase n=1 Tax=Streptomyces sp. ME18-1-4 TaxID=3028685 RepID=UPI0029A8B24B|nr:sugar transferase [Streptomyces sp. ME18-1-4]MDX3245458.1 sugar transferase [Streptomyces sp. ME18-1-4]